MYCAQSLAAIDSEEILIGLTPNWWWQWQVMYCAQKLVAIDSDEMIGLTPDWWR